MAFRLTPLRMSVSQPSMSLPLPSVGDHKGNAFPMMSSSSLSSSASSSSCCVGGEWSPEALDYHMLEVTVMTHHMDKMATDVVLSKWLPEEEESKAGDYDYDDDDDASVGKMQTALELTESNDNSVSVYLDANARAYHQEDTWDHNDNLTLGQSIDDLSSGSSEKNGRRPNCRINRGCSWTPDSDATEIPDDEDDEEEEDKALFLSVSSDMDMLRRSSMALTRSCSQSTDIMSSSPSELLLEGPDCTFFGTPFESQTQPLASSKVLSEDTQISSSSSPSSANVAENAKEVPSSKPDDANRKVIKANSSQPAGGAAKTRPTKTVVSTVLNTSGLEAKRVSKLDLRNVKAKVGSQCAQSPLKTPNKNKCAPAYGKRAVPRKEEAYSTVEAGGKKQRSSAASPVVLIPRIRGKSISHLQTNRKTAATAAAASEKRTISPTLRSASPRSVASEGGEDGNLLASTTKELQELSGTTEDVGDAHEECVQGGQREATAVEKQRNHSRKVSSKLGPNTRLQGRGTSRVEKRPSQPALNPGLEAGGAPRINYSDNSSTLGHAGQSESPAKGRQIQGQCQGIPKPRTAAERASSLASTGPARSKSKATANQQPASSGWPAAVPAASKLPVKGLPTSLSSLSLGSNENNGATSNAPTASAEEQPSRGTLPVGSRCTAATTSTNTPRDTVSNAANTANTAAPKHPAMRSRALSLQARTTATGLKAPSVSSHNTARTATNHSPAKTATNAAGQGLMKLTSHNPLQRSGSARLSRLNSTVDRNKPREARATHSPSSSCSPTGGSHQAQLLPPPEPVADVVDVTVSLTPVLPVPTTDTTSTPHTGASALGFKARTGSRSSLKAAASSRLHHASRGGPVGGGTNTQSKEKNQAISQLRKLLLQGNKRVEALATVIQHLFTEHEESLKQKKELALELANLRDELVCSTELGRLLQSQKQEGEQALTRLEQEHRDGLLQLEDRLRSFYQTEWDKVHQTYQDEADKCRMLMEQQVEELRSRQEAERQSQEVSHCQELECVKQQYEDAIQELKRIQQTDLENMQKTLKETETSLSDKVSSLLAEKESLHETVRAEEERRKGILNDKSLKDSHTVYLEQELDSLKVVLEIKNNQLHQKDKKLMEMEKMVETNVKLEECLNKVQQENEDYRARMDKHAALSRQLSTEQAKLQQTLQKESKVNKRLSMENEELLWKLHNGDLLGGGSPRRLSPTSPFGSPRNSASFPTSAPLSPR